MSTPVMGHKHLDNGMWYEPCNLICTGMWYVASESGEVQSTLSHEGSCDIESTKENVDMETTTAEAAGGKRIEEIACELVTVAIQKALIELRNKVWKLFIGCMKLLE